MQLKVCKHMYILIIYFFIIGFEGVWYGLSAGRDGQLCPRSHYLYNIAGGEKQDKVLSQQEQVPSQVHAFFSHVLEILQDADPMRVSEAFYFYGL